MKTRIASLFLALGLVTLLLQVVMRLQRDADFYSTQLNLQTASIEKGLRARWSEFLLKTAREGKLDSVYTLRFDRTGEAPREPFYPFRPAVADWKTYRQLKRAEDLDGQREFLKRLFATPLSWDRALALEEWHRLFREVPIKSLSPYEESRINPEAREAYRLIFEQFESGRDYSSASPTLDFDIVLFKASGDGDIEAIVPSATSLRETLLPAFMRSNSVPNARLGHHPWDIHFEFHPEKGMPTRLLEGSMLIGSFLLVACGLILYALALREQKTLLLTRVSFLNQVVHELKTPLAGLKLHLQLMQRYGPNPDSLQSLEESVSRIDHLFDDIIQINRPSIKADPHPVSADELNTRLKSCLKEFGSRVSCSDEFKAPVLTDVARLEVILRNLVSNAIRYGEHANISIMEENLASRITVSDHGPGVPVREADRIFEEFYRSDEGRRQNADGLGIGLALAKKLATEIGATLTLLNPGEKNARFELKLPRSLM